MRHPWLIGLLIFVVVAFLRVGLVSTSRFTDDEAAFYRETLSVSRLESFPRLGPPITGGEARHPGSGFFYLMAPSQFFRSGVPAAPGPVLAGSERKGAPRRSYHCAPIDRRRCGI
jgi:hypothetical protein